MLDGVAEAYQYEIYERSLVAAHGTAAGMLRLSEGGLTDPYFLQDQQDAIGALIALAELSPREREVLDLYFWGKNSMPEVGRILDTSTSYIQQVMSRTLIKLRTAAARLNSVELSSIKIHGRMKLMAEESAPTTEIGESTSE